MDEGRMRGSDQESTLQQMCDCVCMHVTPLPGWQERVAKFQVVN